MSPATTEEAAPDGEPTAEAPTAAGPPRPPALVLAVSLAVVFGLLAAVFAVLAVTGDDGEGGRALSLRRAAGDMAEAFFTWDHRDLDAHEARVIELATGSFRDEYEERFDIEIREAVLATQSTCQAFVKDIYASEIEEERAQAVVVVDLEQDGVAGPWTVRDIYLLITFVEVDGEWKADDVTDPFPITGLPGGAGASGSTSTTTAPVPVP